MSSVTLFWKLWAGFRTAVDYWLHWSILFINLFVFSPLLVFTFLLLDKGSFSFALWVAYCHDYYNALFPFIGFASGLLYGFRFGLKDRYRYYLWRVRVKNGDAVNLI